MTDLYPWMEYQFRIIAHNEYGAGEASIPSLKIKTWDARKDTETKQNVMIFAKGGCLKFKLWIFIPAPVVSPTDLAGYGGRNGEIVITWTVSAPLCLFSCICHVCKFT